MSDRVSKLNLEELRLGLSDARSWHAEFRDCAWVYVGGLAAELTEGDVLCVMSQWGEVEDLHLIRDDATGRHKGFAFLKYEDARSAVLAVDNFAGVPLLGHTLRVDHKKDYLPPKTAEERAADKAAASAGVVLPPRPTAAGRAYVDGASVHGEHSLARGVNVFSRSSAAANMPVSPELRPDGAVVGAGGGSVRAGRSDSERSGWEGGEQQRERERSRERGEWRRARGWSKERGDSRQESDKRRKRSRE